MCLQVFSPSCERGAGWGGNPMKFQKIEKNRVPLLLKADEWARKSKFEENIPSVMVWSAPFSLLTGLKIKAYNFSIPF